MKSVENCNTWKASELVCIPTCTFGLPGSSESSYPEDGADRSVEEEDSVKNWQETVVPVMK